MVLNCYITHENMDFGNLQKNVPKKTTATSLKSPAVTQSNFSTITVLLLSLSDYIY